MSILLTASNTPLLDSIGAILIGIIIVIAGILGIRKKTKNNKVPIVENRAVARALYNLVPIDGIIPSDMFVAVAEILAMVFRNKQTK